MREYIKLVFVLSVGVFFLVGCSPTDDKVTDSTQNNVLTNDVEVLSDEAEASITDIVTSENDGGSLIINDINKTFSWKNGTIKYLKASDNLPSGMFIKVIDTKKQDNGMKKVIYVTPTVDEVFENLNIDMNDLNLSFTVDKVKMNKYVSLKINDVSLPKGANGRVNKFFPLAPKVTFDSEKGEGWNILKKLSATFNFPIFSSDDNSTTLGLTGKFILNDIKVTHFKFKTYSLTEDLGYKNIFLNSISPTTGIDYQFGMAYKSEKEFALEGKFEKKFSISNFAKGTLFECGLISKKEFEGGSVAFTSTGYEKSDICLGSIGLAVGYDGKKKVLVPLVDANVGSGKSGLKIGIDIAMILGLNGNIHFVAKLSGKKKSYESFMGGINTHNNIDNILYGYSKESAKKDSTEKAKWVYKASGELSGDITHYVGLAVAIHISNMTPLGIRGYGGIKANAKGEAYYRFADNKWGGCWDVGLDLLLGADVISKNSLDINITNKKIVKFYDNLNSKFNIKLDPNLKLGINYKLPLGGKPTKIVRYNSCESKEYTAEFIREPKYLKDFTKDNIRIDYVGGGQTEPKELYYFIYDARGNLISNSSSLDILATTKTEQGEYRIETIVVIDEKKSIKTMIKSKYIKKEPLLLEPKNIYFTSDTSALTSGNLIVSFNNANIEASTEDPISSYTYDWGDKQSSVLPVYLSDITHTYSTEGKYTVTLTVTTESGMTYTFSEEINVGLPDNTPPTANAGEDKNITTGESVTLNGTGSDAEDAIEDLTFVWTNEAGDIVGEEASITISSNRILAEGNYIFTLTVTDSDGASSSDTVTVTVVKDTPQDINLTKGLVAHYEFEGDANDSSGNGNHGVEYGGVSYTDGVIGQAGSFDGVDDYIEVKKHNLNITDSISVSLWRKSKKNTMLLQWGEACPDRNYNDYKGTTLRMGIGNYYELTNHPLNNNLDRFHVNINSETGNFYDPRIFAVSKTPMNEDIYENLVFIFNNKTLNLYKNGQKISQFQGADKGSSVNTQKITLDEFKSIFISKASLKIGANESYCGEVYEFNGFLNGELDDLRIYNRALNESEIKRLYEMGSVDDETNIFYKGFIYKSIISPNTGRIWLDRNLGASQVCTSFNDSACYGDYYQWGRGTDGHEKVLSEDTTVVGSTINPSHSKFINHYGDWLSTDINGNARRDNWAKIDGTGICPIGFRVPTIDEFKAETLDIHISTKEAIYNSFLKLGSASAKFGGGGDSHIIYGKGDYWAYWTNSPYFERTYQIGNAEGAIFAGPYDQDHRANGMPIRCIQE